jgi:hypothetical protein
MLRRRFGRDTSEQQSAGERPDRPAGNIEELRKLREEADGWPEPAGQTAAICLL